MTPDLLLIPLSLALIFLAHVLRSLLSQRIPDRVEFSSVQLQQPPDIMADLFRQTDRELSELGFTHACWASVRTKPDLPGSIAPLIRLYRHTDQSTVARVSPPHTLLSTDRCQVVFLSISANKTFLSTANRLPAFFPPPSETRAVQINTDVDTLADQFRAHCDEMARRGMQWQDRSGELGAGAWSLILAGRYEQKSLRWLRQEGRIRPLREGGAVVSLSSALRYIWLYLTGRQRNTPPEHTALPPVRAAYLFDNWQRSNICTPPLPVQLGLYLLTVLSFGILAERLWGWEISSFLLLAILLHEAGHWLAMRLKGYRNPQILLLPMVGGITFGSGQQPSASDRAFVTLMGLLPGILAGWLLLWVYGMDDSRISTLALTLLAVNYLNLLPLSQLDGGQLLKTLVSPKRSGFLIAFELLGAATFIALAWASRHPLIATLGLIPLFSAWKLMRRQRIIRTLHDQPGGAATESVIQAIDRADKRFRPLIRKAPEILALLRQLRLKPVKPAHAALVAALYIGCFTLPPTAMHTLFPGTVELVGLAFAHDTSNIDSAYRRAMSMPSRRLLQALASLQAKAYGAGDRQILFPPAASQTLAEAEQQLGTPLDSGYRQILAVSDGFADIRGGGGFGFYYLLPLERVRPFAEANPAAFARLREALVAHTGQPLVVAVDQTRDGHYEEVSLPVEKLAGDLLIGITYLGEYLLLEPPVHAGAVSRLLIVSSHLGSWRYLSLHDYLAYQLALMQSGNPAPSNR